MNRNISTFLGCESEYENARIAVFGAPFDGTTSYRPGTRFASRVMRAESYGLETYSMLQDRDLADISVFDCGDLELPFGNTEKALGIIERHTASLLDGGKLPVMIGGEHLVTLPAVAAAHRRYPELRLIHFDAHADFRDDYLGERLSHATVVRRAWELLGDGRIYQFGIRSGDRDEARFMRSHARAFAVDTLDGVIVDLLGKPVYLTIDLDVLDPSVFPGTGTPEPGGISFGALAGVIARLRRLDIVAADLCELSPPYDPCGISVAAACKALRELLLAIHK